MRDRIKILFQNKIIMVTTLIVCTPIIAYLFKILLDNGRLIGTIIRKLFNN